MNRRNFTLGAAVATLILSGPALGQSASLVLEGDLGQGESIVLSDADLLALPQLEIETSTIWTEGVQKFSGPLLSDVLAEFGAGRGNIELVAVNDYRVIVDIDLISETAPIIANRIDGMPFTPRNKGPFWVIFPYDSSADYQNELVYAASVWQLTTINVLKEQACIAR
jgi:hypothetical protein